MAPEQDSGKRVGRKLIKKRKPQRSSSLQYPERLKVGNDEHEDVTAARGMPAQQMNQSVFSMIAAAGSKVDFNARFEDGSSESEEEIDPSSLPHGLGENLGNRQVKVRDHKPLTSLSKLNLTTIEEKHLASDSTGVPIGQLPLSTLNSPNSTPREAPVMSRMLEAEAHLVASAQGLDIPKLETDNPKHLEINHSQTSLVMRLREIFGFEKPEEVISEYRCWLLQSVLLQGYLYITQYHICFYAYLPKKNNAVVKSGHLSKRGRQNPKYNRYWFTLKGDVMSYYTDPSGLYFPSGNIDLRYGISATLTDPKENGKDATCFSVVTHQRTYFFKADSATSAKDWAKTLQTVIFRTHNDGDSVKISLPLENVIDIEESPVIDFAETLKIRVVDSDETFAIDDYFFSFFSFGKEALHILRSMVDDTLAQKIPAEFLSPSPRSDGIPRSRDYFQDNRKSADMGSASPQDIGTQDIGTPVLLEGVRATLLPVSPHRSRQASPHLTGDWGRNSGEYSRKSLDFSKELVRASFEQGRRSASTSRMSACRKPYGDKPASSQPQGSSDSYVHELDQGTESSALNNSSNNTQASGSQILCRSDVFRSPTIPSLERASSRSKDRKRKSELRISTHAGIKLQLPGKSCPRQSPGILDVEQQMSQSSSAQTLQQLVKAGAYPLQRAAGFAGYLKTRSKKMSSLLATESMGYVEKVSGMWAGGGTHYGDRGGAKPDDPMDGLDDEDDNSAPGERFRGHFALPASEKLQAAYFGYLHRVLPLYGKIYISNRNFCFRSLLPGTRTKMVLPLKDIENVDKEKGFRFGYSGLVVVIRGHEELFFEFGQAEIRDDCAVTLHANLESMRYHQESGLLSEEDETLAENAKAEHRMLQEARLDGHYQYEPETQENSHSQAHPILFDDPRASILNFKPKESLRITCLTIGSRGDVQPYIALCKGLLKEGHRPKIATHAEFEPWVRKHGIDFASVDGDPAELMRICVENGMFTISFLREASSKFRGWIDELLSSAWKACQETDILIESPSAMAGIHIAEALKIPYFRAFTMPWTRTRSYPHAFAVPEHKRGGAYNYVTYIMFDNVFWKAIASQVNRWRKKELCLHSTSLDKMQPNKVPFLYNFSPSVVVPPIDYSDWIRVTGYWFLDEASDWVPPVELVDFMKRARTDEKKIVYIGFGSIVVADPAAMTESIVEAVLKADVRCILSKGWSDRLGNPDATVPEVPLPPEIHQIKSAPHDWLFKQIDAAAHHGGAGTTGASLRAGLPTIVKPFFGDQFFFGSRLEDLGVGICLKKLNTSMFARALWEATHSQRMIDKARALGAMIREENGVESAIQAIYRDLEYAKSLIKHRAHANESDTVGDEESWTFIGDEPEPSEQELAHIFQNLDPTASSEPGNFMRRHSPDIVAKGNRVTGRDTKI